MATVEQIPVQHIDGVKTDAFYIPNVLSREELIGLRQVAEARGSVGGAAVGGKGFIMYNDPRSSNSGGSLHPIFHDWPFSLKTRADLNHATLRFGGRFGRAFLQKKGGQFRDTFSYRSEDQHPGIRSLMTHQGFHDAARRVYKGERPIIEPQIMFANFMVPGETQAIHTDVPEFRGVNRTNTPEWVLVVMRHSGLFERWRMPICTAVVWISDHNGGELAFYPSLDLPGVAQATRANSALVCDTDSLFHGVDAVGSREVPPPVLPPDCVLRHTSGGKWSVVTEEGQSVEGFRDLSWSTMRMSIQWKAYCWRDEAERRMALVDHTDDLDPSQAFNTLLAELAHRRAGPTPSDPRKLCEALCTEFCAAPKELKVTHPAQGSKL